MSGSTPPDRGRMLAEMRRGWVAVSASALLHVALLAAIGEPPPPPPDAPRTISLRRVAPPPPAVAATEPPRAPAPAPGSGPRRARRAPKVEGAVGGGPARPTEGGGTPGDAVATGRDPGDGAVTKPRELDLRLRPRAPSELPAMSVAPPPVARAEGPGRVEDWGFDATIHADGRLTFEDNAPIGLRGLGLAFDLSEAILRMQGGDLSAYEKRKFAERTRALRERLAERACREDLDRAVVAAKETIHGLLAEARSDAERRLLLFSFWDDCVEAGSPAAVAAGARIRATVLALIRAELPPGSPGAFTPEEVLELNARRRSAAEFRPYARPDGG